MKKILLLLPAFVFCVSCSIGETDKKTPVHESEELNIGEKKKNDSNVIVDTLHR